MSETTTNLGLVVPDVVGTNPTEKFDVDEFIRNNFLKIDEAFGDIQTPNSFNPSDFNKWVKVYNIADYANSSGVVNISSLNSAINANEHSGVVIYVPHGEWKLQSAWSWNGSIELEFLAIIGSGGGCIISDGASTPLSNLFVIDEDVKRLFVSGVEFRGLNVNNPSAKEVAINISANGLLSAKISKCVFRYVGYAVVFSGAGTIDIVDCVVDYPSKNAFDISTSGIVNVCGNTVIGARVAYNDITEGHGVKIGIINGAERAIVNIVNNTIYKIRRNGIELVDNGGVYSAVVSNNTIVESGTFVDASGETEITTRGSAVYINGNASSSAANVDISDNVLRDSLSCGVYAVNVNGLSIKGNFIRAGFSERSDGATDENYGCIRLVGCPGVVIKDNIISYNKTNSDTYGSLSRNSISLNNCDNAIVSTNNITGGYAGISVYGSDYVSCTGNVIEKTNWSSGYGIYINGSSSATSHAPMVIGNNINGVSYDIRLDGGNSNPDSSYINNAVVVGNNGRVYYTAQGEYSTALERVGLNAGYAGNEILATPYFAINNSGFITNGGFVYNKRIWLSPGDSDGDDGNLNQVQIGSSGVYISALLLTTSDRRACFNTFIPDDIYSGDVTVRVYCFRTSNANVDFKIDYSVHDLTEGSDLSTTDENLYNGTVSLTANKIKVISQTIPSTKFGSAARQMLSLDLYNSDSSNSVYILGVEVEYVAVMTQ